MRDRTGPPPTHSWSSVSRFTKTGAMPPPKKAVTMAGMASYAHALVRGSPGVGSAFRQS